MDLHSHTPVAPIPTSSTVSNGGSELNGTAWDVLIAGTGIQQSLLALALSRSGKRILHIDKNEWYGGAEAAFSLQEVEDWVERIGGYFSHATLEKQQMDSDGGHGPKLSFSRAYSLALAPHLIYTQSRLIDSLVSSKAHAQLEFLAMGSWWVYTKRDDAQREAGRDAKESSTTSGKLLRIPTNREDVAFSDSSIDIRAKRSLMKVLRFILDFEQQGEIWEQYASAPFTRFLSEHFKLPKPLHDLIIALTLTPHPPSKTTTSYALPRIARHLGSTGRFGGGFSSLIPKWGGLSEIVQVSCRSAAVGGATYVLNKSITTDVSPVPTDTSQSPSDTGDVSVGLGPGDNIKTQWIVGAEEDMETLTKTSAYERVRYSAFMPVSRSIAIVSSPLKALFPVIEGAQHPSGAVLVFPSGTLELPHNPQPSAPAEVPPVYLIVHSSDTGECPADQSVIYASTALNAAVGTPLLKSAMKELLRATQDSGVVLWSLHYEQRSQEHHDSAESRKSSAGGIVQRLLKFPPPSPDLAFDDSILDAVKWAWLQIMGPTADSEQFLVFPERESMQDSDEE